MARDFMEPAPWESASPAGQAPWETTAPQATIAPEGSQPSGPTKAQWAIKRLADATGLPYEALAAASAAILPTVGAAGGGLIGAALTPQAGGTGAIPGAMIGGGLGEIGNQALGITDPSNTAVSLSSLTPGGAAGTQAAYRGARGVVGKSLPGAGRILQERGAGMAEEATSKTVPQPASKGLYEALHQHDTAMINNRPLVSKIDDLLRQELITPGVSPKDPNVVWLKQVRKDLVGPQGNIGVTRFEIVRALQKNLNEDIDKGTPGMRRALAKAVYESVNTTPGAEQVAADLGKANATFKQEIGADKLREVLTKATTPQEEGAPRLLSGRARTALKQKIDTDPTLVEHLSKEDRAQFKKALDSIGELTDITPKAGLTRSEVARTSVLGGATIAALVHAGVPWEAALPVAAGIGVGVESALEKVLTSQQGRQMVIRMANKTGKKLDTKALMTVAEALEAGASGAVRATDSSGATEANSSTQ